MGASSHAVLPVMQGIVGVLSRLPAGRFLDFEIEGPKDLAVEVDPQDLTEMMGALGENATKWARGRVTIVALLESNCVIISVEDDGPGIPEAERVTALSRGGRLAQADAGSGLGLAIVCDLCDAYGGVVNLARAGLGGLRVEIRLPIRQSDIPRADQEVAS